MLVSPPASRPVTSGPAQPAPRTLRRIRDGVFFTAPPELPHGPHGMSREEVVRAQRERAMIAVTELLAVMPLREIGIREIAREAHLSTSAFYRCFTDKDDCLFAAYERFVSELGTRFLQPLGRAESWSAQVAGVVDTFFEALSTDLVTARAYLVEMECAGGEARARRRLAVDTMAQVMKDRRDAFWPGSEEIPTIAYESAAIAVRFHAARALESGADEEGLRALGRQLTPWITRMLTL